MSHDPRRYLEQLCIERDEAFSALSALLGRNGSYIQQYISRGVPKRLGEEERSREKSARVSSLRQVYE